MRRPVSNPRNPWHEAHVELLGPAPEVELQIFEITAKSILSKNDSPDLSFNFSLNPYQGCYHGCAYCYARPSHQYLGFGAGTDFERKLMVKTNAPELLRAAFSKRSWTGETVVMSGNTDCYQPLEASYELTRRCIQTFVEFKNPLAIITKGGVIHRDIALLGELAQLTSVRVFVTIPFLDDAVRRALEPFAATIERRFEALRKLSELGVLTGISLSPIIPGLNDSDVPELLERAHAAGATQAMMSLLRLPGEVKEVFFERIGTTLHPKRVEKITHAITEMRGGSLDDPRFGRRFHGQGKRWQMVEQLFDMHCRKLGLHHRELTDAEPVSSTFQRPKRQLTMFD